MNNKIVIKNREPQEIKISGGGDIVGITNVYVNGIDVTEGNVAYVIVPTKLSELQNNMGFITQEVDPTVPYYVKQITQADINKWNNKQDLLVSGTNIKTINDNSIMGSGNIEISADYTAGTGIEITEENVINNTLTSYNDLTDLPTIPDSTSQLLNDSGYVTSEELSEVAFTGSYVSLSNTPTLVSDFINDANYIDMNFIWNMLPKLTSTDSTINLSPTVSNAPLKIELNPSTLSQDATPTPDSPQTIHMTTGENTINIGSKNILNYSRDPVTGTGLTRTVNSDGSVTVTGVPNYNNASVFQYDMTGDLINGEDYVIWQTAANNNLYLQINIVDNGGGATQYKYLSGNASATFTADTVNKTYQMRLQTGTTANWGADSRTITSFYQLEVGTTPSSFEKYDITSYTIDLGDIEYCKIGNYEDRIFKNVSGDTDYSNTREDGAWYIKKNIGKDTIVGTENITLHSTNNSIIGVRLPLSNNVKPATTIISNYFNYVVYNDYYNHRLYDTITTHNDTILSNVYASAPDNTITTADEFKTWFTTHNTELWYVLSTPTYTKITDEDLILELENLGTIVTYNEQTNISQTNADLPFIITAETVKSLVNV